jgi:hypothetical protein
MTGAGSRLPDAAPLLDEWRIIEVDGHDLHLVGRVSGHPHLREGARAVTSRLLWLDPSERWARTWSRLYRLGTRAHGPLPADWADRVDTMLREPWGARRTG